VTRVFRWLIPRMILVEESRWKIRNRRLHSLSSILDPQYYLVAILEIASKAQKF